MKPELTPEERAQGREVIDIVRAHIARLSDANETKKFNFNRLIAKTLKSDEYGGANKNALKRTLLKRQAGLCVSCGKALPPKGKDCPVHRRRMDEPLPFGGYTLDNTDVMHPECHSAHHDEERYGHK